MREKTTGSGSPKEYCWKLAKLSNSMIQGMNDLISQGKGNELIKDTKTKK